MMWAGIGILVVAIILVTYLGIKGFKAAEAEKERRRKAKEEALQEERRMAQLNRVVYPPSPEPAKAQPRVVARDETYRERQARESYQSSGTRTGRFSASAPNYSQPPKSRRDDDYYRREEDNVVVGVFPVMSSPSYNDNDSHRHSHHSSHSNHCDPSPSHDSGSSSSYDSSSGSDSGSSDSGGGSCD